jgi:4-hydroxy-tetrahydrodipicolinate synthase
MAQYNRDEAREWAREELVGVVNCTIPSFAGDLKAINEKAIRHDTRRRGRARRQAPIVELDRRSI